MAMNMDHCRFENTHLALCECWADMDPDDLSEREAKARAKLIALCKKVAANFDGD